MKSRVAGLAVALSAAALLSGRTQEPPGQPQTPTFRTAATLIEFTVVAVDAKGNPVTDLKQDELSVADNGKPRPIALFRFEGGTPGRMETISAAGSLGPGIFTNRSEYTPGPPRNITAIVIDSLNTRLQDQAAVRAQVMRYLRDLPPQTRVALYRTGDSVKVLHDFTDDLASLRAKVAMLSIEECSRPRADVDVEKVRGTRGMTDPRRTAGNQWAAGREFTWPSALKADGSSMSLREFRGVPAGQAYTAVAADASRPMSWFTMYNVEYPLLVGYLFPTTDHPWIIDWQNQPQTDGAAGTARGIEFGTAPVDEGLRKSVERGQMFGVPTYRFIAAKQRLATTFTIFLAEIPVGFSGAQDVRVGPNGIVVTERGSRREFTIQSSQ